MAISATGGTTSTITVGGTTYKVHSFTSGGTFVVSGSGTVEYLIVAGGGAGGGGYAGGGGGAGGVKSGSTSVTAGSYTITVGAGGTPASNNPGGNGGNSSALGFTSTGGGGGGGRTGVGSNGGSGGGGGWHASIGGTQAAGTGTSGEGYNGGTGTGAAGASRGGGGGGAGSVGGNSGATTGGNGGSGTTSSITGTSLAYAGGGGGGAESASHTKGTGTDGGGNGGQSGSAATAGATNTGSGGGGARGTTSTVLGGAGGSGVVILRYELTAPDAPTITSVTSGDSELTVAFTLGSGAPETNIEYSTDNGSTWTARSPASVTSPLVISGLTNETTYQVKLRAINDIGASAASNMLEGTPIFYADSSIDGQVGVIGSLVFAPDMSIEGQVGIASLIRRPVRFTRGIDDTEPQPIIIDDDDEPPFAPPREPTTPSPQQQIIDRAWYRTPQRRTVIVNMDGIPQSNGFLSTAVHGDITWTRSNVGQWSVSLPLNSPDAQQFISNASETGVTKAFQELQLWRGDKLLVWGPVVNMAVNGAKLELTGADPSWYLSRRSVGPAGPTNLLPYQEITPNLYGWLTSVFKGWDNPEAPNEPGLNVTAARLPRDRSQWAIRIEDRNPIYSNDPNWVGFVSFPTAAQIVGIPKLKVQTSFEFSCFIHIDEFISRNDGSTAIGIGLFPQRARPGLVDLIDAQWAQVGDDFPVGVRQRLSVSMTLPASQDLFAVLMVRGPKGVSYLWDFSLQWDGGLINIGMDKADIMTKLVDHLSGNPATIYSDAKQHPLRPYLGPTTYDKTNVKIGTSIRKSGYYLDRVYSFDNSGSGLGLITDLAEDDEASGWKMIYSTEKRWFYRMRNETVRWDCRVWFNENGGNVLGKPSWQFLGEQAANVVKVTSSQGSSAVAVPPSSLDPSSPVYVGDPTWTVSIEEISQAPQDFPDEWLMQYAQDRLWATTRPVALSLTIPARPFFTENNLQVGEAIPVSIRHGNLNIAGLYRIYQMTLKADDTLDLVLTPSNRKGVQLT